jgi:hypothetical protein
MSPELFEDALGDARNGRFLGKGCDLVYLNGPACAEAFRKELGLEGDLISVGNTQVYVGSNDKHIVAVFRGSESPLTSDGFKDWFLTNAVNFLILPEGRIGVDFAAAGVAARFHQGFMTALADVWDPFFAAVDGAYQKEERPVWVSGHSLGGALALLAAWRLERQGIPVAQVITFGAPMIGNVAAAEAFQAKFKGRIYRYVDARDLVPRLPTVSLVANTYGHCLEELCLGAGDTGSAEATLQELGTQGGEGALHATLIDQIWAALKDRIGAHLMGNYLARLAEKSGK